MVLKKERASDRNQIGVPTGPNPELRDSFKKIVEAHFGLDMAKFLRSIVCEVVATYGELERAESAKLDLGNQLYYGPSLVRKVYNDWSQRHPDIEREVQSERKRESAEQSKVKMGKKP